jgi:hypothetical protein
MSTPQRMPGRNWFRNPWFPWGRVLMPESFAHCVGRGVVVFTIVFVPLGTAVAVTKIFNSSNNFQKNLLASFFFSLAIAVLFTALMYWGRNMRTCSHCKKELKLVDISRRAMAFGGTLPDLYDGVVCTTCLKLECMACKGVPPETPCRWCGSAVSPAYSNLLWMNPDPK